MKCFHVVIVVCARLLHVFNAHWKSIIRSCCLFRRMNQTWFNRHAHTQTNEIRKKRAFKLSSFLSHTGYEKSWWNAFPSKAHIEFAFGGEKHVSCTIFVENIWPRWWGGSLEVVKMWHMGKLLCNKENKVGNTEMKEGEWERRQKSLRDAGEDEVTKAAAIHIDSAADERMWQDWVNSNNFSTCTHTQCMIHPCARSNDFDEQYLEVRNTIFRQRQQQPS